MSKDLSEKDKVVYYTKKSKTCKMRHVLDGT